MGSLFAEATQKNPRFFPICTFPQTTSLSNTKKSSDARTNLSLSALRNIPRTTGGLLTPRPPVAHLAAISSARCLAFLTLERAHTRPYTILRQAVKSPSNAGALALIYGRLRGTFPLGLPECIRQTLLPSVRGPDRASRLRRGAVG